MFMLKLFSCCVHVHVCRTMNKLSIEGEPWKIGLMTAPLPLRCAISCFTSCLVTDSILRMQTDNVYSTTASWDTGVKERSAFLRHFCACMNS